MLFLFILLEFFLGFFEIKFFICGKGSRVIFFFFDRINENLRILWKYEVLW